MFRNLFSNIPPVVKNLLILNVLIWLAMSIVPALDHTLNKYLALYYFSSPAFQPLQLFTYMFLHGNFMHLFFNMFALLMFGRTIELAMGSARFLFYYVTCGICAWYRWLSSPFKSTILKACFRQMYASRSLSTAGRCYRGDITTPTPTAQCLTPL